MKDSGLKSIHRRERTSLTVGQNNSGSLTQKKYQAALNAAQEIIHGDMPQPGIQDSLNCGKLRKLICYIQTGSCCILLWGCYTQQFLNM
ncbi:hypothetical protein KIAC18_004327 [Sporomusa sphaeroides]|jgi:hypothetical protein|uniref:hypothetical protein n=1 Tax=Sporomusa sphaeroides TaxID=47679 RepID=UPI003DA0BB81